MSTGASRILQHAAAGAVVLACVLAVPRSGTLSAPEPSSREATNPPEVALDSLVAEPAPQAPRVAAVRTPFPPEVERWRPLAERTARVVAEAEGATVDPDLLLSLIEVESAGDARSVSPAGAVGLAQVRPGTFADMVARHPRLFPKRDPSDPAENVLAGALYLVWCGRYLGAVPDSAEDWRPALNAYNLGPLAVREARQAEAAGAGELPLETRQHQGRILALYASAAASVR